MEIVTGFQGKNHVTARQISRLLRGALGPGTYVLDTLDQLAAEVLTANTVRVGTGDVVIDGTFYTNEAPEELIIENGVTGLNRNDLIVCRYTKAEPSVDEEGNVDYTIPRIEDGVLAVVKGTPTSGTPIDPELHSASVYDENTNLSEEALYRIPITGLSVGEPVPLFQKFTPAQEFRDSLSQSRVQLAPIGFSTSAGGWSRVVFPTGLPASAVWVVESITSGRPAALALASFAREDTDLVVYFRDVGGYSTSSTAQATLLVLSR